MEVFPDGKSTESTSKGICIFLVNDDHSSRFIVDEMLQYCSESEVLHIGSAPDVLNTMWKRKDRFELILTNAHSLEIDTFAIVQRIEQFKIPTIYKSPNNMKIASKGQEYTFAAYIVFSLSRDELDQLWQIASDRVKEKKAVTNLEANSQEKSMSHNAIEAENNPPSVHHKRKREDDRNSTSEQNRGDKDDSTVKKKPRMVWTPEMHNKFLEAIEILGPEKAVPNKIVKIMNVPGLTRENVASHLQKYRDCRKREPDDMSRRNEYKGSYSLPYDSTSRFNLLQRNPIIAQQCYTTNFHHGPYFLNPRQSQLVSTNNQRDSLYVNTQMIPLGAIPQTNNYLDLGSSGYINQNRQQDLTLYDQNVPMGINVGNFSNDTNLSKSCNSICEFVGLRLGNDGKSIEFGYHRVFSSQSTENDFDGPSTMMINDISQQPSHTASDIQLNATSDQDLSELFDFMSPSRIENFPNDIQQDSMPCLENRDDVQCDSTFENSILQEQQEQQQLPSMQFLATLENESTDKCPSTFLFDQEFTY